jgi:hypothetical protein
MPSSIAGEAKPAAPIMVDGHSTIASNGAMAGGTAAGGFGSGAGRAKAADGIAHDSGSFAGASSTNSEVHTFTTVNLVEGEKLVRQAAASFQGTVAGSVPTPGSNRIELTITVPASKSAALLVAIQGTPTGRLRAQTPVSHATRQNNQPQSFVNGDLVTEPQNNKLDNEANANRQSKSDRSGKTAAGPASPTVNQNTFGLKSDQNQHVAFASGGRHSVEMKTVRVVLLKGK